jgi:hypothetical protein
MNKTNKLRKSLWATIAFAEVGALLAFVLGNKQPVVADIAAGNPILLGIELLILAGLSTYVVLRKEIRRGLVRLVVGVEMLLLFFFLTRLADTAVSALAKELLIADSLLLAILIGVQLTSLRGQSRLGQPNQPSAA